MACQNLPLAQTRASPTRGVGGLDWFVMVRSVWFLASNKQTKPSSSVESPTMNGACLGRIQDYGTRGKRSDLVGDLDLRKSEGRRRWAIVACWACQRFPVRVQTKTATSYIPPSNLCHVSPHFPRRCSTLPPHSHRRPRRALISFSWLSASTPTTPQPSLTLGPNMPWALPTTNPSKSSNSKK